MDPYTVIETRQERHKTCTLQGAGKTPVWNQTFNIDVKYIGDDLNVTVYDEDITTSDTVGSAQIKLSALCVNGGLDEWFGLHYRGKSSGTIHLRGQWLPGVGQHQPNMG